MRNRARPTKEDGIYRVSLHKNGVYRYASTHPIIHAELRNMKKIILSIAAAALISCSHKGEIKLIPAENFVAQIDEKQVSLYTLRGGDLTMQVTNFGARVVSLWTPDKNGDMADIELGYDNIEKYIHNPGERFLGAVVGPYANRIAGGEFELDGKTYDLPKNNNGQTLHGGLNGLDMVVWDVIESNEKTIAFSYVHSDGMDGFPGNMRIDVVYTLTNENSLKVSYKATTDAPTFCNLSFHPFFNLKGEGNGTILDHVLVIAADSITPVNDVLIPSGEIADVTGTPFDFREPCTIGDRIGTENEQLKNGAGYDHNWILHRSSPDKVEFACSVYEPESGRYMEVFTDQPALQFYSGNFFDGSTNGKYGLPLNYRESFAIETQKYPDSPHHDNFPSTLLTPGETYTHNSIYKFSVKTDEIPRF